MYNAANKKFVNLPEQQLHVVMDAAAKLLLQRSRHGVHRRRQGSARAGRRWRYGQTMGHRTPIDVSICPASIPIAWNQRKSMSCNLKGCVKLSCQIFSVCLLLYLWFSSERRTLWKRWLSSHLHSCPRQLKATSLHFWKLFPKFFTCSDSEFRCTFDDWRWQLCDFHLHSAWHGHERPAWNGPMNSMLKTTLDLVCLLKYFDFFYNFVNNFIQNLNFFYLRYEIRSKIVVFLPKWLISYFPAVASA